MSSHHFPLAALAAAALWAVPSAAGELAAQEESVRSPTREAGVRIHGKVVEHESGDPLPGAVVSLGAGPSGVSGRGTRVSDGEGRFSFEDVPEGEYALVVTLLGYHVMADTVRVPPEGTLDLILPLSTEPIRLAPVVVTAGRAPLAQGYERRRSAGGARFLVTREDIQKREPRFLSELLHSMPGGMVVPTPPHGYTLLLRGQCRPGIWLDGVEAAGATSVDQLITPRDVEAVEVYHGFELPVEFGVNPCGGILIWTRRGPSRSAGTETDTEPDSGILGRLVRVVVVVALVVLVTR